MSDNNNSDSSRRLSQLNFSFSLPHRLLLGDSPLRYSSPPDLSGLSTQLAAPSGSSDHSINWNQGRDIGRPGGIWDIDAPHPHPFGPGEAFDPHTSQGPLHQEVLQQDMARSTTANRAAKQEPKKPITTLFSALPENPYKDQDETTGSERSLPYIKVQLALLKYLRVHASDTLTPLQARRWTEAIEPRTKMPKAEEALRLCYYMRSQGFDSYAVIRDGVISLFLVDARLHANDENSEHLYWMQHVKTNLITYMAPSSSGGGGGGVMRAGVARRNALAANDRRLIPTATGELRYYSGLEAPLGHMRGGAGGPADGQENGMHAGAEGRGATASAAGGARQPETVDVIAQLRARISALDRLLENPVQDPDAVAAVLLEIGELEGQMGRA